MMLLILGVCISTDHIMSKLPKYRIVLVRTVYIYNLYTST